MGFDSTLPIRERIQKRRKQKRQRFFITLFMIIICAALGIFISKQNVNRNTPAYTPQVETVTPRNISSESSNKVDVKAVKKIDALKNDLESYIKGCNGQYGVYYINLVTKEEFGINATNEFVAASTLKIPLNLYLFNKIKEGTISYESSLTYLKEDYEEGTGEIQDEQLGTKYTVKELSRLSIEKSDNIAANMLIRLIGLQSLKDYMKNLGGCVVSDTENLSCPKDMAHYMQLVYGFCNSDSVLGKDLMGYFLNTGDKSRLPSLLPKDIKIAHKIGNQVGFQHDVGIIFADTPYILSIMSKDDNEEEAYNVIANISKRVFDFMSQIKVND